MSGTDPIWIGESDVVSLMHLGEAIDALEAGLRQERNGRAANMVKTHVVWNEGNTLHAIGAVFDGMGWFGTKSWGHTTGGATPLFLLWEAATGRLAAIIEAFALGQMRTGGVSGVATRWMSAPDADELAIIGSGKQALTQVAAVDLVRPLKRVRVYSPNPESRASFVSKLRASGFAFDVVDVKTVDEAVLGAPIITTVTRARAAFLHQQQLADNVHINAVGAITPERREVDIEILRSAKLAVVDDPVAARRLAIEFRDAFGECDDGWQAVRRLCDVIDVADDRDEQGVSIFKAMGMGISDLSLAVAVHDRARLAGVGRPFPHPQRSAPRLRA
jgi:alanine dehydrogenase